MSPCFPLLWNIRAIYGWLGQDPQLAVMAERFVHFGIWLFLPALMIIVIRSFLSAYGSTRVILLITVCGVLVNGLCDYALMFGNLGFPRLDLAGSGIATTMVNCVMLALMLIYVLTHRRYRRYHIFARFLKPDWPRFRQICAHRHADRSDGAGRSRTVHRGGIASGLARRRRSGRTRSCPALASLAFMVPLGLSQATTVRVGLALGHGDPEGVRKAGWASLAADPRSWPALRLLFFNFPHQLVALFLNPLNRRKRHARWRSPRPTCCRRAVPDRRRRAGGHGALPCAA